MSAGFVQPEPKRPPVYVRKCPPGCGIFDCPQCWKAGVAMFEGLEVIRFDIAAEDEDEYEAENTKAMYDAAWDREDGYMKRVGASTWRWVKFR